MNVGKEGILLSNRFQPLSEREHILQDFFHVLGFYLTFRVVVSFRLRSSRPMI